jgi:hypothetical protein
MSDDEIKKEIKKEIDAIKLEQFKKDLVEIKKKVAKYLSKPELEKLYYSKKTGQELKGTALLNSFLGAERKYLAQKIESVKKQTESIKKSTENSRKISDEENKLQKQIIKDIKIEQNNRKKQSIALTHNSLVKKPVKKTYDDASWLSNTFKNTPSNRNLTVGNRPLIQNNKTTPFLNNLMGMINSTQPNLLGSFANTPANSARPQTPSKSNLLLTPNLVNYTTLSLGLGNPQQYYHQLGNIGTNIIGTGQSYNIPTQKQAGKNNILAQSLKTHNTKKTNNIKTLVSWLLNNNVGQDTIDNLMYDANGRLLPLNDIENILKQEKLNVIALQNVGKPVTQSYEDMSITDKILYNKAKNRKIRLNKYGQDLAIKDPTTFDNITSGRTDDEILNTLEAMYDADKLQLQIAKNAEEARKKAETAQRKADIDQRKQDALARKNQKEQERFLKQQQRLLEQEQKERRLFYKSLMSVPKPINLSKTASAVGYGGLGLLGGGLGGLLGLAPQLAMQATGGIFSGAGNLLGKAGVAIGAGLGLKGLCGGNKGLQNVPTKAQSKAGGVLSKIGGVLGGFGLGTSKYGKMLKPLTKYGAMAGAGIFKKIGQAGVGLTRGVGGIFGKIPGLGRLTRRIPLVHAILSAGAIVKGIYDAWNTTDNTMDFLKESAWNTGGNLISMATLGMIDADDAKTFGKNMADKVQNSQLYKEYKNKAENGIKDTWLYKGYNYMFGDENPNVKILEKAKERYKTNNPEYEDNWWNSTWAGNFIKINSDSFKRDMPTESLPEYFWNNRNALRSKNNLLIPSWVKDARGQMTDNFKNMTFGGDSFNMGSTSSIQNKNTTTNNNSVVNVFNEPQQNKTTAVMALGGAVPFMGMVLYQ